MSISVEGGLKLVLLAGGSGSRLWPLSRRFLPKQFLPLRGRGSLLELVSGNFRGLLPRGCGVVVTSSQQAFGSAYKILSGHTVLAEPCARNTAAACGLAAAYALARGKDPVLLVSPCDYLVKDRAAFQRAVAKAAALAGAGQLALLGVKALRPDPAYGYISAGPMRRGVSAVHSFFEKPELSKCRRLLRGGNAYWHTGVFAVRASRLMALLEEYRPELASGLRACCAGMQVGRGRVYDVPERVYAELPSLSIEKVVFEKKKDLVLVELSAGWTDIENWASLYKLGAKDGDGNVLEGDVLAQDCRGTLLYSGKRLVAGLGLKNAVVADTGDALLVCPLEGTAAVARIPLALAAQGRLQEHSHETVHRPWGSYTLLGRGATYLIKRLELDPGAGISLQYHRRRSEHWTVARGVARVKRGGRTFLLRRGASIDIPLGVEHSLSNPGKAALSVVEVQNGSYIGEDDIVRVKDPYRRPR